MATNVLALDTVEEVGGMDRRADRSGIDKRTSPSGSTSGQSAPVLAHRRTWLDSSSVARVRQRLQIHSTVQGDESVFVGSEGSNPTSATGSVSGVSERVSNTPGMDGPAAYAVFNDPDADTCPVDALSFAAFSPITRDAAVSSPTNREGESFPQRHGKLTARNRQPTYMEYQESDEPLDFQRIEVLKPSEVDEVVAADLDHASAMLIQALVLRMEYMVHSRQSFCTTTERVLTTNPREGKRGRAHSTSSSRSVSPPPPLPIPPVFSEVTIPDEDNRKYGSPVMRAGIVQLINKDTLEVTFDLKQPHWRNFIDDLNIMLTLSVDGPVKSFAFRRLSYLGLRYEMHGLLNEAREVVAAKRCPHRDFYNVRKVDTHVHAASCMNHKHLLRFIKKRAKENKDEPVCQDANGKTMTLGEVFTSLNLTPHHLSVDMLDVHADRNTFHRFDKFNMKYNPLGQSRFREIFLKTDNFTGGKFFAQLLREVIDDLEESKYQMAEPRVSIYGRSKDEWGKLARWAVEHKMASANVRWLIQVPRLYNVYKSKGQVKSFQDILDNIFLPLFEATLKPKEHPDLFRFLTEVAGFDSVDDESKAETTTLSRDTALPSDWTSDHNPPYAYYLFYMYANITALNNLRRKLGYNVFTLRPHCGEAGPVHHLAAAFLLSENISHGLLLRKVPALQYLYYLAQIGVAMSPLSNNSLFLDYHRSPLPEFRSRGLAISLSTDDPLMFHYTREPLIEEYSIAAQVWKLGSADMAELARNSVLMSGFQHQVKQHWLGRHYDREGVEGNDIRCTNVPDVRIAYRHETLVEELQTLCGAITQDDESPQRRFSKS